MTTSENPPTSTTKIVELPSKRPPFPTTTAHAVRLCLFQPTRRPKPLKNEIRKTPWGIIRINGRLGQQHADVLEAICYEREKRADLEDGRIKLLVDPARVRKRSRISSGEQFQEILEELMSAVIEIIEPEDLACIGHLLDHIDIASKNDGTILTRFDPLTGGQRPLWRVEIGKAFTKLVRGDLWIGYDPAPIAELSRGISQAIARHVLTHKHVPMGGWHLDGLIRVVAGETDNKKMRERRMEVRREANALAKIGIVVKDKRVLRSESVEQTPGSVEQTPGSVEQTPGASSKRPGSADTESDT